MKLAKTIETVEANLIPEWKGRCYVKGNVEPGTRGEKPPVLVIEVPVATLEYLKENKGKDGTVGSYSLKVRVLPENGRVVLPVKLADETGDFSGFLSGGLNFGIALTLHGEE